MNLNWLQIIRENLMYLLIDLLLINTLCILVREKGFKYIYTSLKSQPLVNKYEKCGFSKGDPNCQEMIKLL